jgi:Cu(I)/Ag(I) efflux system membrane fusion protein
VIVAAGEGRYAPVDVRVGRESGDLTEITGGLEPGARVVASGQFLIDSEASLRGALQRMNAPEMLAQAADPHAGHGAPAKSSGSVQHRASGVVRAIAGGDVFIEHGAIPSAGMGAMTMGFKAPSSGVPAGVKQGVRVDFAFTVTPSGAFALSSIVPAGAQPKKASP